MNETKFKLGHVLIKVDNLHLAVKDFEQMGFKVTYGSNPKKATNAMIYFKDGSFIELFSTNFRQPISFILKVMVKIMSALKHPYAGRLKAYTKKGEGFRDYALDVVSPSEFENHMERLNRDLVKVFGPRHMKRKNVDGELVSWSLQYPSDSRLPFFMSPYSPALDTTKKSTHPNGTLRLHSLRIITTKWEEDLNWYKTVFEKNPEIVKSDEGSYGHFHLNGVSLILTQGKTNGISQIGLTSERDIMRTILDSKLCHGANILLENQKK